MDKNKAKEEIKKLVQIFEDNIRQYSNPNYKEAQKELEVDDPHKVSVLFYNLKRKGWIDIKRSQEDKRKKVYKLISPEKAVGELENEWRFNFHN